MKSNEHRKPEIFYLESWDRRKIRCGRWKVIRGLTKAIVVAIHGIGAYLETYSRLASALNYDGIETIAIELRGFGEWKGADLYQYCSMEAIEKDISTMVENIGQDYPVFLLGDSLGALICFNSVANKNTHNIAAICMISPFLMKNWMKFINPLIRVLSTIIPRIHINVVNDIETYVSDKEFIEDDRQLGLGAPYYSLDLIKKVFDYSSFVEKSLESINLNIPVLTLVGNMDNTINKKKLKRIFCNGSINGQLIEYENGKHFLHNDIVRDRVAKDICKFFDN